ncbi:SMI1/KNR4 family protein [Macrococcus brunensis]|uniref:SMI1/KNR4 family protein n=1 Tax=Macrococcus brunensis TaxID=198483 RepID=UPI001EF03738|nr:SMI1/KNR4 family protein [Macrococcus brunensis]ULG73540.1 SMI1/KNR4 family protein [Macrococcus brunensis]
MLEHVLNQSHVPFKDHVNPGATDEELQELEEVFGEPLDPDFKTLYQAHNGESFDSPGLFFGLEWLSLDEVMNEVEFNQDEEEEFDEFPYEIEPAGAIKPIYYHAKWLPFAADGFGNFLAVDMDPGENGKKGQIISYGSDEETFYVVADSLNNLLSFIAKTIEEGNYEYAEDRFTFGHEGILFLDQIGDLDRPVK